MPRVAHRTLLALAAAVVCGACSAGSGPGATVTESPASTPPTADGLPGGPPLPAPAEARVVVLRTVLDGDSIEAIVDGSVEEIRVHGVNTPEREECWSEQARDITAALLEEAEVQIVPRQRDQYGRLLAHLWADGVPVGLTLIERGAALAVSVDPEYRAAYLAAEDAAYSSRIGLWARDACGPAAAAGIRIAGARFDAPGPDDRNPNGEWVQLANDGAAIDLTGWVLRDESSIHRFTFPAGFVLGAGAEVTVYSGCGPAGGDALFWCEGPVWSNDGDTALVLDHFGNVVDRVRG